MLHIWKGVSKIIRRVLIRSIVLHSFRLLGKFSRLHRVQSCNIVMEDSRTAYQLKIVKMGLIDPPRASFFQTLLLEYINFFIL